MFQTVSPWDTTAKLIYSAYISCNRRTLIGEYNFHQEMTFHLHEYVI